MNTPVILDHPFFLFIATVIVTIIGTLLTLVMKGFRNDQREMKTILLQLVEKVSYQNGRVGKAEVKIEDVERRINRLEDKGESQRG